MSLEGIATNAMEARAEIRQREVRPVEDGMNMLRAEVDRLDQIRSELWQRLAPIIGPGRSELKGETGVNAVPQPTSQHVQDLTDLRLRVGEIGGSLVGLLECVEV